MWERDAPSQRRVVIDWKPEGTYALLIAIGAVWAAQFAVAFGFGSGLHAWIFAIGPEWWLRPWTLITSTLSHSLVRFAHILVNGLVLWFFGPLLERILGTKRFLVWFFGAGAISGVLQVTLDPGLALGASGAIMFVIGALAVIMPKETVLIWGILPAPFWAMAIGYAVLDLLGAIGPANGIGNVAHLAGMALGAGLGWKLRQR